MQGWQAWGGDSASVSERTAEEQPPPPQQPPVERQPQQRQQDCVELLLARLGDDDEDHADEHQAEGHAVPVGVAALVDESAEGDLWHTCRRTTCAKRSAETCSWCPRGYLVLRDLVREDQADRAGVEELQAEVAAADHALRRRVWQAKRREAPQRRA